MTSAELITELQAARPAADMALRDRVRALTLAEAANAHTTRRRLVRLPSWRIAFVAVPATAVVLLGLAGIAGVLDSPPQQQQALPVREGAELQAPATSADRALKAAAGATNAPAGSTPAPTIGRAQNYSAQLTLSVKNVDALSYATQQALRITRDLGGYLVTASYATSDAGSSSLTLKVPTANVQNAIVRLSALGKIVSQQVQIDDLQGQVELLTKREAALREQIARLSAKLAAPGLDAEAQATLAVRRDAARNELARTRAQHSQVNAQARYATIQLGLQTTQSSVVPTVPSRFDRAVDRAVEILALEATIVLYALVIVGPIALLVFLAWLARRELRRRQDDQLLSAS